MKTQTDYIRIYSRRKILAIQAEDLCPPSRNAITINNDDFHIISMNQILRSYYTKTLVPFMNCRNVKTVEQNRISYIFLFFFFDEKFFNLTHLNILNLLVLKGLLIKKFSMLLNSILIKFCVS